VRRDNCASDCCDRRSFEYVDHTGADKGSGSKTIDWNRRSWASMGADTDEYTLAESMELDLRIEAPRRIDAPRCILSGSFSREEFVCCADAREDGPITCSSSHISDSYTFWGFCKLIRRADDRGV
jgi:hypothetical protein